MVHGVRVFVGWGWGWGCRNGGEWRVKSERLMGGNGKSREIMKSKVVYRLDLSLWGHWQIRVEEKVHLHDHPFVIWSVHLFVSQSIDLFACRSIHLSTIGPSVCLSFHSSACLSVCLSACLSACLSVYLSVSRSAAMIRTIDLIVVGNRRNVRCKRSIAFTSTPFLLGNIHFFILLLSQVIHLRDRDRDEEINSLYSFSPR